MTLSLPLRINLISLVFASLVAAVLTALGGWFLHREQTDNAEVRAELAADELSLRANKLLALELRLTDFMGFEEQCAAVVRNDGLLRGAALFDANGHPRFRSPGAPAAWPAGVDPARVEAMQVLATAGGATIVRPLQRTRGEVPGFAVVTVDGSAVVARTLASVAWLVASAMLLFALGLVIQQGVFWRTVGRPLAGLVRTADDIQPDNLASLKNLPGDCSSEDDIGRLYCAFQRLMRRLMDARAQLVHQNEQLEATVRERTLQLQHANAELALDIERRKQLEEELRTLASTDPLTGLANRSFILPYARRRLEQARRDGKAMGLMMFDFDGFKAINDTHGHAAGDAVLRAMGQRLGQACRSSEAVARLGGDEFLLAFEGIAGAEQVQLLAQRMAAQFDPPIVVGTLSLKVGVSIGAAWFPSHAGDFDGLIAAADAAMYAVKQRGGGIQLAGEPQPAPPALRRAPTPAPAPAPAPPPQRSTGRALTTS